MTTDEKFNQIYQTIVNENANEMEVARGEAQIESKNNIIILIVIILINIALNFAFYKLANNFSRSLLKILIVISVIVYPVIIINRGGKSKRRKYKMDFKAKIIGAMVKSFEEELEFTPQCRFTIKRI